MTRAVGAGAILACFGVAAVLLGVPALFPALGPTLYLLALHPEKPPCDPRRIAVGHTVGLAVGLVARAALGPPGPASLGALTAGDVAACSLALTITTTSLPRLDADHPPAAATTLIAALGAFGDAPAAALASVGALAGLAGILRRTWNSATRPP